MTKRKADDWTIERWKTEPRLVGLEFTDARRTGAAALERPDAGVGARHPALGRRRVVFG